MAPATLKIKTKLLEKGDTIEGLANDWGFTRALLTKVVNCERGSGPLAAEAQKRLARYMKTSVKDLFGEATRSKAA